jgi:hypothetical protein
MTCKCGAETTPFTPYPVCEQPQDDSLDEHPMNPINQEGYDDWSYPDDEKMWKDK